VFDIILYWIIGWVSIAVSLSIINRKHLRQKWVKLIAVPLGFAFVPIVLSIAIFVLVVVINRMESHQPSDQEIYKQVFGAPAKIEANRMAAYLTYDSSNPIERFTVYIRVNASAAERKEMLNIKGLKRLGNLLGEFGKDRPEILWYYYDHIRRKEINCDKPIKYETSNFNVWDKVVIFDCSHSDEQSYIFVRAFHA
jgi:hypothetical protein